MPNFIELKSADGTAFSAYVAQPAGKPRGAVVVLQEIFGVNAHIRAVADAYAADGYLAVAPPHLTASSATWNWATRLRTSRPARH